MDGFFIYYLFFYLSGFAKSIILGHPIMYIFKIILLFFIFNTYKIIKFIFK